MFKSIIWATDGSEAADAALPHVNALAIQHQARVTVVHCDEMLVARGGGQDKFVGGEYVRDKIERQVRQLGDNGVDAHAKFVGGIGCDAAKQISDTAIELHADLIIVATRGHTQLRGLLLGSVTQRLLHTATCPVFVVPSEPHPAEPEAERATAAAAS